MFICFLCTTFIYKYEENPKILSFVILYFFRQHWNYNFRCGARVKFIGCVWVCVYICVVCCMFVWYFGCVILCDLPCFDCGCARLFSVESSALIKRRWRQTPLLDWHLISQCRMSFVRHLYGGMVILHGVYASEIVFGVTSVVIIKSGTRREWLCCVWIWLCERVIVHFGAGRCSWIQMLNQVCWVWMWFVSR